MRTRKPEYGELGTWTLGPIGARAAHRIANAFWDVEDLHMVQFHKPFQGVFHVRTRGGFVAAVGTYNNRPAIVNKTTTGGRELIVIDKI